MPVDLTEAYALIGASVVMHVTWNLLARHVAPHANFLWWGLAAHLLLLGPYAFARLLAVADWGAPLVTAMLVSAAANALYFVALRRAYHYAPVALVYPLARSSPLLIALWSWLLFAETLGGTELAAIGVSVLGLWILAATSRHGDARHALPWAGLAALSTSVYSLSDKVAVGFLPDYAAQLGFISVGYAVSFLVLTLQQRFATGHWLPARRPPWPLVLIGGLCIGTAYALVVRAMGRLPAAHVVTFTNAGIVLAAVLSIVVFREREAWRRRLVAALIVSLGLVWLGWATLASDPGVSARLPS